MIKIRKQGGWIGSLISSVANRVQGQKNRSHNRSEAQRDRRLQALFAQQGIRWRVADAKAAGIHPLAAMGAQITPATPSAIPSNDRSISAMGQNLGRAVDQYVAEKRAQEENKPPPGPVVYPLGTNHPHYTDPRTGEAKPYSPTQLQRHMAIENHNAQLRVMNAETQNLLADANKNPDQTNKPMFEVYNHPRLGKIPYPNQVLGEVSEALADKRIRGLWLNELRQTPGLYEKLNSVVVKELGQTLGSIAEESPDLLQDLLRGVLSGSTKQ